MPIPAGRSLQIINIDTKQRVKAYINDDDIVFWTWISESNIGMVTHSAVYHWSVTDPTSPPQKIFDLSPAFASAQIINYLVSPDENWLLLICISDTAADPSAFKVTGFMQLYNRSRGVSQAIPGHAAVFAEVQLDGRRHPTKFFSFAVRTASTAKAC